MCLRSTTIAFDLFDVVRKENVRWPDIFNLIFFLKRIYKGFPSI